MALVIISAPVNTELTIEEVADTYAASDRIRELLAAGSKVSVVEGIPLELNRREGCLQNVHRTILLREFDETKAKVFTCSPEDFK